LDEVALNKFRAQKFNPKILERKNTTVRKAKIQNEKKVFTHVST
jgi:hypothetical protein